MEEDLDHLEEEDSDCLVEDLWLEDSPRQHNNQYLRQQTLKQWEVSHKYSMEIDPKPTTSLKKSKDIFALTQTSPDIIHHTRK